jgi:cold shock CspA family protein
MTGIVKTFNGRYGFISPLVGKPGETPEVYFHATAVKGKRGGIPAGAEVSFKLVRGEKGPQAAEVEAREVSWGKFVREQQACEPASPEPARPGLPHGSQPNP